MNNTLAHRFAVTSLAIGLLIPLYASQAASASARGHFDQPGVITVCANRVWVLNSPPSRNSSLTEINETSGAVIRVLDSGAFDFNELVALGCGNDHLWAVSQGGMAGEHAAVTEVNATSGRLIRVIQSPDDGFDSPNAIAVGGSHVWITNGATPAQAPAFGGATGNSVTELNASNGSLVRVISATKDNMNYLDAVVIAGSHVWVASADGLTEFNSSNSSLVRTIKIPGTLSNSPLALTATGANLWEAAVGSLREISGATGAQLHTVATYKARPGSSNGIGAIASNTSDVWVANLKDSSVSEINVTTGNRVMILRSPADKLYQPEGIALSPRDVWVTSWNSSAVIEFNIITGVVVRVIT